MSIAVGLDLLRPHHKERGRQRIRPGRVRRKRRDTQMVQDRNTDPGIEYVSVTPTPLLEILLSDTRRRHPDSLEIQQQQICIPVQGMADRNTPSRPRLPGIAPGQETAVPGVQQRMLKTGILKDGGGAIKGKPLSYAAEIDFQTGFRKADRTLFGEKFEPVAARSARAASISVASGTCPSRR